MPLTNAEMYAGRDASRRLQKDQAWIERYKQKEGPSFADFVLAVIRKDELHLVNQYQSHFQPTRKAAMAESSGLTGGYAVPQQLAAPILRTTAERAIIRPRATVVDMYTDEVLLPHPDITTVQSAGVSPFFAGVQMYWTEEALTRTETEPQLKQLNLKAQELSGYLAVSNACLEDGAGPLSDFLIDLFANAIAWYEDFAFIQGNGVGKPLGLLNSPAALTVTRAMANQITFADVSAMMSKLPPGSMERACWIHSPSTVPQLTQLKDGASRAIFLSMGNSPQGRPDWALATFPAYNTEKLPALGTKGDLILFDPAYYAIGHRDLLLNASRDVKFLQNQTVFRIVERVDGQPWPDKPVTLQDGTTQVSPVVILN